MKKSTLIRKIYSFIEDNRNTDTDEKPDFAKTARKISSVRWHVGDTVQWEAVFLPGTPEAARKAHEEGLTVYRWTAVHVGDGKWATTGKNTRILNIVELVEFIYYGTGYGNAATYYLTSIDVLEAMYGEEVLRRDIEVEDVDFAASSEESKKTEWASPDFVLKRDGIIMTDRAAKFKRTSNPSPFLVSDISLIR